MFNNVCAVRSHKDSKLNFTNRALQYIPLLEKLYRL